MNKHGSALYYKDLLLRRAQAQGRISNATTTNQPPVQHPGNTVTLSIEDARRLHGEITKLRAEKDEFQRWVSQLEPPV